MLFTHIFDHRTFHALQLTSVFQRIAYQPNTLGAFGERLFATVPSRTRDIGVAKTEGRLSLIPTSPIGAPPVELELQPGDLRSYRTKRLAKGSTLYAESLGGLLLMPDLEQIASMQTEIANRGAKIRTDIEYTLEHMRLGAVLGQVRDADGQTVIVDWFDEWRIPRPASVVFGLANANANLRALARDIRRTMRRESGGGWIEGQTEIHALCGNEFYEKFVTHPKVEQLFLNYQAAQELRGAIEDAFVFGGVVWHDYRGTDDGVTMSIAEDEARFFPVGGNGVFQQVWGPAEFDPWVNSPGQDLYALTIADRDRGAWVRIEAYNYPFFICLRPEMLRTGKI